MTELRIQITEETMSFDRMYRDDASEPEKKLLNVIYELMKAVAMSTGLDVKVFGEEQ